MGDRERELAAFRMRRTRSLVGGLLTWLASTGGLLLVVLAIRSDIRASGQSSGLVFVSLLLGLAAAFAVWLLTWPEAPEWYLRGESSRIDDEA